ncbi:gamma-glutamyltransferase [Hellea balneolensis]|uniref:gamma-glutamyltransferase n=1 Tax=Hellea balneolensis TaxID=287478 RepID=UPI00047EF8C2|nr:gamma-glutamyltransferase [Hellea balneolensis]
MKLFSTLLLGSALALSACTKTELVSAPDFTIAKTEVSSPGMVASANPLATQAGLDILKAGGSAVDAAIAVQAMLGLVEPQSSGLGGGAFMVVYDPKTAKVWAYNGRETAPAAVRPDMFLDSETGEPLRYFDGIASGISTGVPGAVVMLHKAHEDYGTLAWGRQMEPAIKTAEEGFAVSPRMAGITARMGRFVLKRDDRAREYFYLEDGETTIPEGFMRDNPAYAETLRALQKNPRALLEGPIAEEIIRVVQEEPKPGTLTLSDMAAYQPQKTEALCSTYRKHIICGAQPPSSGAVAVQSILRTLENFDMSGLGQSAEGWHVFAEASFLAYADRDKYVADPDFVEVETGLMLNKDYLKSRAVLINMDKAMTDVKAGNPSAFLRGQDATPDNPGTSHFTVVDKDGLVVSMTTTVEAPFGSQRMAAGFMLNNQLTDFSFRAVDAEGLPIANAPAPGKRPRSSMAPSIVFSPQGEFLFSTGSPGGNSIIAYTAKTIVGILDWGLTPQEAIELPNLIARNGRVAIEAKDLKDEETGEIDRGSPAASFGMPAEMITALEEKGHKVRRSKGEFSGLHIIYRQEDGRLIGGADPRREGTALEVE